MGTSSPLTREARVLADHPHAYGDKFCSSRTKIVTRGSSPRVWGQAYTDFDGEKYTRIIPTRMGTRIKGILSFLNGEDHPHAYGDKP